MSSHVWPACGLDCMTHASIYVKYYSLYTLHTHGVSRVCAHVSRVLDGVGETYRMPMRHICTNYGTRTPRSIRNPAARSGFACWHAWVNKDCSLFANALVYSPPRAPRAFPWPGRVDGTSASMTLVSGPPVPSSEAALSALQALLGHPWAPCVHRGGTSGAAAPHTA